ncbi:MAG: 30S ribosome-binding factor RbfA [Chlorobi bacterium]|nr:30S ribosome-binding factor RbfA [Chlorobiota bacterium]
MSIRTEKVAGLIKEIIAEPINEKAREFSAGLVTVTSVRMTPDLHLAKVYISIFGSKKAPEAFLEYLEKRKGQLRHYLGQNIRLRYTPAFQFFLDDTLDQMDHIQKLVDDSRVGQKDVKVNYDDYDESAFPEK